MDVYFRPLRLNHIEIFNEIVALLRAKSAPTEVSVYVELRIDIEYRTELIISEISIYNGYELRSISPTAQAVTFNSPFGLRFTSVRREVISFAGDIANNLGGEVVIECGSNGVVNSAAGGALFGITSRTLYSSNAIQCVERQMVIESAKNCDLKVVECEITKKELTSFDELFYVNHYGVTSISRYDRRTYTSIISGKIASGMTQPWR